MSKQQIVRRRLIIGAALAPMLLLPGCATTGGRLSLVEAIRRLLTLSSQRAFAQLLQPGGFYDSSVARIALPGALAGGSGVVGQLIASNAARDRLTRIVNSVAERGAERAAPVIADAITTISIADALAIVRGGPMAATMLLEGAMGNGLVGVMFPAVDDALRLVSDDLFSRVLRAATGVDVGGIARDVTDNANRGIWRAIGLQEAAIRADPQTTGDPLLTAVFGIAGAGR